VRERGTTPAVLWTAKESLKSSGKTLVPQVNVGVERLSPLKMGTSRGRPRGRQEGRETGASGGCTTSVAGRAGQPQPSNRRPGPRGQLGPSISYMEGPSPILPQRPRSIPQRHAGGIGQSPLGCRKQPQQLADIPAEGEDNEEQRKACRPAPARSHAPQAPSGGWSSGTVMIWQMSTGTEPSGREVTSSSGRSSSRGCVVLSAEGRRQSLTGAAGPAAGKDGQ
jgi:hypothetical protein